MSYLLAGEHFIRMELFWADELRSLRIRDLQQARLHILSSNMRYYKPVAGQVLV